MVDHVTNGYMFNKGQDIVASLELPYCNNFQKVASFQVFIFLLIIGGSIFTDCGYVYVLH